MARRKPRKGPGRPPAPEGTFYVSVRMDREVHEHLKWLRTMLGQPMRDTLREILLRGAGWVGLWRLLEIGGFDDEPEGRLEAGRLMMRELELRNDLDAFAERYPRLALAASPDGKIPASKAPEMIAEERRILGKVEGAPDSPTEFRIPNYPREDKAGSGT